MAASFSVFDASLDQVLVQSDANELNPNGVRYYRQTNSGRRSQGAELEITFALNVENLSNENYVQGGATGLALELANPRTTALKTSYSW